MTSRAVASSLAHLRAKRYASLQVQQYNNTNFSLAAVPVASQRSKLRLRVVCIVQFSVMFITLLIFIMSSQYKNELNAIASSSFSEATPQHKGGSLISELTASNVTSAILEEDKEESSDNFNVGTLLSSVSKNIVLEDNKEYGVAFAHDLCKGELDDLCCEKRAGGKNTFCTRANCDLLHRADSS